MSELSELSEMSEIDIINAIEYFQPEFQPELTLHRESEVQKLRLYVFNEKPYPAPNFFIYGGPGTGKTMIVQKLISEVQSNEKNFFYVNARLAGTMVNVLAELLKQITDSDVDSNLNPKDYTRRIMQKLPKNKINIFVLDEIDKVMRKKEDADVLYHLLRPKECYNAKVNLTLLLIANDVVMKETLFSQPVKSSFGKLWAKFYNYTPDQLYDILYSRTQEAFGGMTKDLQKAIHLISDYAGRVGDCRFALQVMGNAIFHAENGIPTEEDAQWAISDTEKAEILDEIENLRDDAIVLLRCIEALAPIGDTKCGTIYDTYSLAMRTKQLKPISQKQATRLLKEVHASGILDERVEASKGAPLSYHFRVDTEVISEVLRQEGERRPTINTIFTTIKEVVRDNQKQRKLVCSA